MYTILGRGSPLCEPFGKIARDSGVEAEDAGGGYGELAVRQGDGRWARGDQGPAVGVLATSRGWLTVRTTGISRGPRLLSSRPHR